MTRTDLARQFLDRLNGGDLAGAAACLAPSFRFEGPFGEVRDGAGLIGFFEGMGPVFSEYTMEIVGVTAGGDRVALEAVGRGVLRNGNVYNNNYHFLFEIGDDGIHRWREYCDTRAIETAFGPMGV